MVTVIKSSDLADGVLVQGAFAVDSTIEKFQLTEVSIVRIAALAITKAPATALALAASKTINTAAGAGELWGVFTIQINASGTISTLAPTTDQVHADEPTALAAALVAASDNVVIGYLTIQAKEATKWTSVTDSLTDDVVTANFSLPALSPLMFTRKQEPRSFRWVGGTDADHKAEVVDGTAVVWVELVGVGLLTKEDNALKVKFLYPFKQLNVWSLESGTLYIYH